MDGKSWSWKERLRFNNLLPDLKEVAAVAWDAEEECDRVTYVAEYQLQGQGRVVDINLSV